KQWLWTGIRSAPVGRVSTLARGLEYYADRVADRSVHVDQVCAPTLVQNEGLAMAGLAAFSFARPPQLDARTAYRRVTPLDENHRVAGLCCANLARHI